MGCSTANSARGLLAAAALIALSAWPAGAAADDAPKRDPQVAGSLFNRARELMDQGKFTEACPMLEESQRLDPGGGTLLNLAVCLEGAGKLASAEAKFQEALSQAIRDKRDDRVKIAEERLRAIQPRLSKLTVEVAAASRVRGLQVALDGARLPSVAWGVPITVDGGKHRVDASAPGFQPRHITVEVKNDSDAPRVVIELSPLKERAETPQPPQSKRKKRETRVSPAGWAIVGSGIGLAATGIATGVAAVVIDDSAEKDALAEGCNLARNYCPGASADEYAERAQLAQALGWTASVSSAVGGLLLLIGPFRRETVKPVVAPAKSGAIAGFSFEF